MISASISHKQRKPIFLRIENPLFFEFSDLGGKTASVNHEEIGKLLSVKRDLKGIASRLLRLHVEICKQFFARGSLGGDLKALMKKDRFHRKLLHHIEDQLLMEAAIIMAGVQDVRAINQHNFSRLIGYKADRKRARFRAGKFLRKNLRGGNFTEDTSVSVIVHLHHLHGARQNDADVSCGGAFGKDRIFFIEIIHARAQTNEHTEQILLPDIGEKRAFFQNLQIFFQNFLLLLKIQQIF